MILVLFSLVVRMSPIVSTNRGKIADMKKKDTCIAARLAKFHILFEMAKNNVIHAI